MVNSDIRISSHVYKCPKGIVTGVDDPASIMVNWDNGSGLNVVYGEDEIRILFKAEVIKEQCRKVASTGKSNMLISIRFSKLPSRWAAEN